MGGLEFPQQSRIALDTSVIIYSVEKVQPYFDLLIPLWLGAKQGIKTPDAIHLATAMLAGCNFVLTNDSAWRKASGVSVAVLDDYL